MTVFAAQSLIFICILIIAMILAATTLKQLKEEADIRRQKQEEFRRRKAAMSGKDTLNRFQRTKQKILYNLDVINMPHYIFWIMEAGAAILGFFFGKIILSAPELAFAMAIVAILIPIAFIAVRASWYKQNEAATLENCMVMITGSYRASLDIIKAIQDNVNKPNVPVAFKNFLSDVTFVDSSVERGLRKIAASFNNRFFDEWIEVLIKSQYDSTMIDILPVIVDEMNEAKKAQKESASAMKAVWREYIIWVVTIICVPLILRMNQDWYDALVYTPIGKALVFALLVGLINSLRVMVKISRPIDG